MWLLLTAEQGLSGALGVSNSAPKAGPTSNRVDDPRGGAADRASERDRSTSRSRPRTRFEASIKSAFKQKPPGRSKPGTTVLSGTIPTGQRGPRAAGTLATPSRVAALAMPRAPRAPRARRALPPIVACRGRGSSASASQARDLEAVRDVTAGSTSSRAPTADLASTGGIDVGICQRPALRRPLRPPRRLRHRSLRRRPGLRERAHDRHARPSTRSTGAGHTRSATCQRAPPSAFVPTIRGTSRSTESHGHSLMGKPFSRQVPQRVLAQPKQRPRTAGLRPRQSRGPHEKCARAGFDGVEYDVVDAYAQGHKVTGWHITAHQPARLRPGPGLDRTSQRALRGAQERHRPGPEARAAIRLSRSTSSASSTASAPTTPRRAIRRSRGPARRCSRSSTRSARAGSAPTPRVWASARSRRPPTSRSTPSPGSPAVSAFASGISLPGFMIPAGSSRSLAARRVSIAQLADLRGACRGGGHGRPRGDG